MISVQLFMRLVIISVAAIPAIVGADMPSIKVGMIYTNPEDRIRALAANDLMNRVVDNGDDRLLRGILAASRTRSPEVAGDLFREQYGDFRLNESTLPGFVLKEFLKVPKVLSGGGVKYIGAVPDAVEMIEDFKKFLMDNSPENQELSRMPVKYKSIIGTNALLSMSPEVLTAVVNENARLNGAKTMADYRHEDETRQLIKDSSDKEFIREVSKKEIPALQRQLGNLADSLNKQEKAANTRREKLEKEEAKRMAREDLELSNKKLEAKRFIARTILTPVVGLDGAGKIDAGFNAFIQGRNAILQYGPKGTGLDPDRLLFTTNMIQTGMSLLQGLSGLPQEDPTMKALQAIMAQLKQIEKKLDQIEGKIDDLSAALVNGFERTLSDLSKIKTDINHLEYVMSRNSSREAQTKALQEYLAYNRDADFTSFNANRSCSLANGKKFNRESCVNYLSDQFVATGELVRGQVGELRQPDINRWSNQTLSVTRFSDAGGNDVVLEQLSLPFYFSHSNTTMRKAAARNHEAAVAFARSGLGLDLPATVTIPNAEVLQSRLTTLVDVLKNHPELREEKDLIDNAIARIDELHASLLKTVGDSQFMKRLNDSVVNALASYESAVREVVSQYASDSYSDARKKFYGKELIQPCPFGDIERRAGERRLVGPVEIPASDDQGRNLDSFIPQIYWNAQELGLGNIGMCVAAGNPSAEDIVNPGDYLWLRAHYKIKIFFNEIGDQSGKPRVQQAETAQLTMNAQSILIAMPQYKTKIHYRGYFSVDEQMIRGMWSGGLSSEYIAECTGAGGGRRIFPGYEQISLQDCANVVEKPQKRFMQYATNGVDPVQAQAQALDISKKVNSRLSKTIFALSSPWIAKELRHDQLNHDVSSEREYVKNSKLEVAMRNYAQRNLLAQNILLTSHYHGNRVSTCLEEFMTYSPRNVAVWVTEAAMNGTEATMSLDLDARLKHNAPRCKEHNLNLPLQTLRTELMKIKNTEVPSPGFFKRLFSFGSN